MPSAQNESSPKSFDRGAALSIGGASGFWGDAAHATEQLLKDDNLDFIVYDYLAEITMSIMARARAKNSAAGYAGDFVTSAMAPNLRTIKHKGVRIIANAGGVNPRSCAAALKKEIAEQGLDLSVACVTGDDLLERLDDVDADNHKEMFSGAAFPARDTVFSVNAYLGAFPVAQALDSGADIVVTGRCVDSAVTLGACIHHFGWSVDDINRLAMGSLAGHIIECGTQVTGGNFTDWASLVDQIDTLGYPIAEVASDGQFLCRKPAGTGGTVSIGTVAEQMLYEIGDPQAYCLPDVVCDFSDVTIEQLAQDLVLVSGAKGRRRPNQLKVCATYRENVRGAANMTIYGENADQRANALAEAILRLSRRALKRQNLADFAEVSIEILGNEHHYGASRKITSSREVVLKVAVKHEDPQGIEVLSKSLIGLSLASPPGLCGFQGGRPKASPVIRLFSFLIDRSAVPIEIEYDDKVAVFEERATSIEDQLVSIEEEHRLHASTEARRDNDVDNDAVVDVPLIQLAWVRSGDKGDKSNIGVIARAAEYYPYIVDAITVDSVAALFAHFIDHEAVESQCNGVAVERFELPGANALNFLIHNVLGGGGVASLRNDPQGKGYAQLILDLSVAIPVALSDRLVPSAD